MMHEYCPNCDRGNYEYIYGELYPDGMQIEPDRGYCKDCGFHYSQHVDHSEQEQVKRFRETLKHAKETP